MKHLKIVANVAHKLDSIAFENNDKRIFELSDNLDVFLKAAAEDAEAPRPEPWAVLYAKPNLDGSRKKCSNCVFWVVDSRCVLHKKDLVISEDFICGYHVYGSPLNDWKQFKSIDPLDPDLSGLERIEGGTSCDTCKWSYEKDDKNWCKAVMGKDGKDAEIQPKGCCSRWEKL